MPMPQVSERRRFKPQLIETSRRARRVGDPAPATRPTDKTDITPYTNHIYVAKTKARRKNGGDSWDDEPIRHPPPTRRESEDEGVKQYLLDIAAKEAARQMEEVALAAFPNSRAREGGVAHFYFREGSDSDNSAEYTPQHQQDGVQPRVRRKSSNLGLNWWHKHMQNYAEKRAHDQGEQGSELGMEDEDVALVRTDSDLDKMDLPMPPDPLWTTTNRIAPEERRERRDSVAQLQDLRSSLTPFARPESGIVTADDRSRQYGDAAAVAVAADRGAGEGPGAGFGRPFGAFGLQPDNLQLHRMRQAASPPMLGKDLKFRRCPSPKQTKLETDHPFIYRQVYEEHNRDTTGQGGLWRGYCCRSESSNDYVVPADLHGANMLVTPYPPGSPRGAAGHDSRSMSEEPESTLTSSNSSESLSAASPTKTADHQRARNGPSRGLHMLHGLDGRLRREKAQVERDEKIASEFDDYFITQVYNYLSLGYPATARSFDEELSKISRVSVEELCRDDEKQMAKGHMFDMDLRQASGSARCPRWRALRSYITEWARQHPDLDNLDPLAWGVRERRGSWAI
ncbi:hypothetical protein UVI_02063050 [Ustilaginoidea virens]|nr:hypothetical protein UVI_02063050 [Ustilaginoidea virens]